MFFPSNRRQTSRHDCVEIKTEDYQKHCVLCMCNDIHTRIISLTQLCCIAFIFVRFSLA